LIARDLNPFPKISAVRDSSIDAGDAKIVTEVAAAGSDDVMAMISDLLARQKHWQKQQSQSEQLIARMADQLEQSQRVIQSLANGVLAPEPAVVPPRPAPKAKSPADPGTSQLSWEKQRALLMSEHGCAVAEPDAVAEPGTVVVKEELAVPKAAAEPVTEAAAPAACPRALALEVQFEHEMSLLEHGDQSEKIRWLRNRLEDRLRESEIEISIERARIGRERRELERMRAEFEEEVMRMRDEELANSRRARKTGDDRWSKFFRS
jgi:hypothetical protein